MMTPEEQLYRDLWLSEMWKPCPEYLTPIDPRPKPVEKPRDKQQRKAA